MATNAQVQSWIQFALQQPAAESYLHDIGDLSGNRASVIRRFMYGFNDPTHTYISGLGGPATPILPAANRSTEAQANSFLDRYQWGRGRTQATH
jgi:hypothetical protein